MTIGTIAVYTLELLFGIGILGSGIVILLTAIEDVAELSGKKEVPDRDSASMRE